MGRRSQGHAPDLGEIWAADSGLLPPMPRHNRRKSTTMRTVSLRALSSPTPPSTGWIGVGSSRRSVRRSQGRVQGASPQLRRGGVGVGGLVESEGLVGAEAFGVHADEDVDVVVDVVVELDVVFGAVGP